jgi:hypothetical protein
MIDIHCLRMVVPRNWIILRRCILLGGGNVAMFSRIFGQRNKQPEKSGRVSKPGNSGGAEASKMVGVEGTGNVRFDVPVMLKSPTLSMLKHSFPKTRSLICGGRVRLTVRLLISTRIHKCCSATNGPACSSGILTRMWSCRYCNSSI